MTLIDIILSGGAAAIAITAIHGLLAKYLVEPMLERRLNAQSNDLKASLVSVKAFDDYKAIDQREHDQLTRSMIDLRHSVEDRR